MVDFNLIYLHRFQIEILGVTDGSSPEYFYSVEGLSTHLEMDSYTPGGANRPYFRSSQSNTSDLVLRRPLVEGKTKIAFWCEASIDSQQFKLTQAHILVLNKESKILAQWIVEDAYPRGIAISPFCLEPSQGSVLSESITLGYARLVRTK